MRAWLVTCLSLCACGRLRFDISGDGGGGAGDGTPSDVVEPQPAALLFYYALEDDPNVGGGADDSSGNNRLAPCLNPNPCPLLWDLDDFRGTSRICDFEDGTLHVAQDSGLAAVSTGFTVAVWAKIDTAGCLIAMPGAWQLCTTSPSTVVFTVFPSGATQNVSISGEWNHVAVTWNGSSSRLFIDGVGAGLATRSIATPAAGAVIGASNVAGTADRLDGWLDEIRLYRTVLTPAEIAALAQL